ncbi:MAG: carboxypeptidase-like regulatory domain-containing protein, partial [Haloechinothrix sp.]
MIARSMLGRALAVSALIALAIVLPAASAAAQDGESVRGTIRGPDGDPVEGISITVTVDGAPVGSDSTGSDGRWEVELPGPGEYDIALDLATLPEDAVPRTVGGEVLTGVSVSAGQARAVIFPLVTPERQRSGDDGEDSRPRPSLGPSFAERFTQALANGIV